jgi:hypothetical protein
MIDPTLYLSIVVTSRNDDHGGRLLRRTQIFINGLAVQCERYQLRTELIIVEWNPPQNKVRLADALCWPKNNPMLEIRIIEVPPAIHRTFSHADNLPLFQMIAKNVGIRRAKGSFILATNIDVLFSNELISFIAKKKLETGKIYRIDRDDVDAGVPREESIDEQLLYCKLHLLRVNKRLYTKSVHEQWDLLSFFKDYFVIFFHKTYRRLRYGEPYLHLNASGDFTLLSREDWFNLRGYPEFEMFSLHLDSIFCYAAFFSGIQEVVLNDPLHLYHIEHSIGSGATPGKGSKILDDRIKKTGLKNLKYRDLIHYVNNMHRKERPLTFNSETWGLFKNILVEQVMPP